MSNNIIFHNNFHVGDVVISKPFVKEIMKFFPDTNFFYAHKNNEFLTHDLCPYISYNKFISTRDDEFTITYDNITVINTWFGKMHEPTNRFQKKGSYDICCFESQLDRYNSQLNKIGIDLSYMDVNPSNYFWEIDNIYINNLLNITSTNNVLLFTNKSLSHQSDNDDIDKYIPDLCLSFPNITFYITDTNIILPNIINLNKIFIKRGIDLFQFAELSKYCNIIVGNPSGPFQFTWIKSNLEDPNKLYITNQINDSIGEVQFCATQKAKTICSITTKDMITNLKKELC